LFFLPTPSRADTCERSELLGAVKSVSVTEELVDPTTGKIGAARLAFRTDVSKDGSIVEMTIYAPDSTDPLLKFTSTFESGRPIRQLEIVNGKTVSTTTCSYDAQGRLVEARTDGKGELNTVEVYEYESGSTRRRSMVFGRWKMTHRTLDTLGRIAREVILDEATSAIEQTSEFKYQGGRQEQCSVNANDPSPAVRSRRVCSTTVRDSHANEIEFLTEGQTRKTAIDYDSVGNWISKRTTFIGPSTIEMIVRRKIEYW
jgi:hypothetical protein